MFPGCTGVMHIRCIRRRFGGCGARRNTSCRNNDRIPYTIKCHIHTIKFFVWNFTRNKCYTDIWRDKGTHTIIRHPRRQRCNTRYDPHRHNNITICICTHGCNGITTRHHVPAFGYIRTITHRRYPWRNNNTHNHTGAHRITKRRRITWRIGITHGHDDARHQHVPTYGCPNHQPRIANRDRCCGRKRNYTTRLHHLSRGVLQLYG